VHDGAVARLPPGIVSGVTEVLDAIGGELPLLAAFQVADPQVIVADRRAASGGQRRYLIRSELDVRCLNLRECVRPRVGQRQLGSAHGFGFRRDGGAIGKRRWDQGRAGRVQYLGKRRQIRGHLGDRGGLPISQIGDAAARPLSVKAQAGKGG